MDRLETVFLINQLRYNQLHQFVVKERMINKIDSEPTLTVKLPRTLSLRDRMTALNKIKIRQSLFWRHGSSNTSINEDGNTAQLTNHIDSWSRDELT
jgi:hypothetical protein